MDSWDDRNGAPRGHGAARHVSRAVAERERGRRRLNTATAGVASLLAAGAVAAVLPGSTSKASTHSSGSTSSTGASTGTGSASSGSGSTSSSGANSSNSSSGANSSSGSNSSNSSGSNSSNSSNGSSNLQAPVNP